MALADRPNDIGLWMAYGTPPNPAGRPATARSAYSQAARLNPKDATITRALQNIDDYVAGVRLQTATIRLPPAGTVIMEAIWFTALFSSICLEGLGRRYLPGVPSFGVLLF